MQSILSTRHRLAALALTLVPSAVLGCDMEPNDEVELRAGYLPPDEPIPGGGVCHGCISDWDISLPEGDEAHRLLRICIDTGVRYTGSSVRKVDDLKLHELLTSIGPHWRILSDRDNPTSDLCADDCMGVRVTDDPVSTRAIIQVKLDSSDDRSPQLLRFYAVGGSSLQLGNDLPSLTFPTASGNFKCLSEDAKAQPLASPDYPPAFDVVKPAMAHITHPSPSGGVRSCSGFLVGPRHILTAEHCFDDLTDLTAIDVRIGESSEPIGVAILHTYDPDHDGLADLDLAILELHELVITKALKLADPASMPYGMDALYGYGYGVLDPGTLLDAQSNDWGQLKRVSLMQTTKLLLTKQIKEAIASLAIKPIYLANGETGSIGLCRGDSGGPIIRSDGRVVAVSFGRILGGVPTQNNQDVPLPLFEPMMRAFAFSRGNICGGTPLQAYVATPITAAVYQWIDTIAGGIPSGPLPPPGFEDVGLPLPPPPETM